jgi:hypothetical protein
MQPLPSVVWHLNQSFREVRRMQTAAAHFQSSKLRIKLRGLSADSFLSSSVQQDGLDLRAWAPLDLREHFCTSSALVGLRHLEAR